MPGIFIGSWDLSASEMGKVPTLLEFTFVFWETRLFIEWW